MNSMADPPMHEHVFLGDDHDRNARRVWFVIVLTASMMVVEITAGALFGSMALAADGWHMSTHAGAMLIAALAYGYARRHARDPRFTFGTGKVGDLAGFASALVLAFVALMIAWESVMRLVHPVAISFDEAIAVAAVGLAVNLVSAWMLRDDHSHHGHGHGHHDHAPHDHGHHHHHDDHAHHDHADHAHHHHPHGDDGGPVRAAGHGDDVARSADRGRDHNLRAAYLHVLADALTSVLAIVALVLGKANGWFWADPLMGVVGAIVILRWSWVLIRETGGVLLDRDPGGEDLSGRIRRRIEVDGDRIGDLHVWQLGPGHHAAIVAVASPTHRPPAYYRDIIAGIPGLSHVTVEVNPA